MNMIIIEETLFNQQQASENDVLQCATMTIYEQYI